MGGKPKDTGVEPSTLQYMDVPAFMPGQQGLLAQQLNAGSGNGAPSGVLAMADYLSGLYRPMNQIPLVQNAADIEALRRKLGIKSPNTGGSGFGSGSESGFVSGPNQSSGFYVQR